MTPDALRAAIASARLRPRMYGTDAADLATYLLGLVTGASPDGTDPLAAWRAAQLAARPAWTCVADLPPLTDAAACDAAEATVAALWPHGDAPAGDECAAFSDVPLDTPMPPAFVDALAALSPAEAGSIDLDALHARLWSPTCSQCGAVDPPTEDAEGLDGHRFARHVDCPTPHPLFASEVGDHGLTRVEQRALVARVRELEAQLAAAQPAVARDALRNGRFTAHCCVCSAEWPLGVRDCPGCGHPDRAAGAVPDRDLCPHCGALDLDHACPKSAATVAGEAFAAEHPYAAAGIMGSATARREDDHGSE